MDDQSIEYAAGDSVAYAIVRAGQHPQHGGTLCLAGDCGNCCAEIDGIAFTHVLTPARPGMRVTRHPAIGAPPLRLEPPVDPVASPSHAKSHVRRQHADVVVIGDGDYRAAPRGDAGRASRCSPATRARHRRTQARSSSPAAAGDAARPRAHEVIIATGAAELHPVCEGNMLRGIYTGAAADQL